MNISDMISEFIFTLPNNQKYNLVDQLNRASVSIPSNITEECVERTNIHFAEFLSTSLSSFYEVETQFLITERRKIGNRELRNKILLIIDEEQKMIFKFREKLLNL